MKPRSCSTLRKSDLNAVIGRATLIILISRYFLGNAGSGGWGLPHEGALWQYKNWVFDTSCTSDARSVESANAMMMTAIGLMSGTSLDGVDVALIETDGKRVSAFGPSGYRAYSEAERGLLRQALAE